MRWLNFERTRTAVALRVPGMILFSLATFALLSVQTSVLSESHLGMTIRTALHVPAFGLIGYGWFTLIHPAGTREFWLLGAFMAAALLAELLEALVYNGISLNDLAGNGFGILVGYLGWKVRRLPASRRQIRFGALSAIALILAVTVCAPVAIALQKHQDQQNWFPVLFDPGMSGAADMVASLGAEREVDLSWAKDGLHVHLLGDSIPGIVLTDFLSDWQAFSTLVLDVENPSRQALRFEMHIRDQEGSAEWSDRYNFQQFLEPGARTEISIPLMDIRNAPETRLMQLNRIHVIAMYSGADKSDTFILHRVALR